MTYHPDAILMMSYFLSLLLTTATIKTVHACFLYRKF